MSTRSCIAFAKGQDKWEGRYHHSDGYPEGLGAFLFESFNGYFQKNIDAMRQYLFTDHPAGYSCIIGADFSMPCGYPKDYATACYELDAKGKADWSKPKAHGAHCFCHGASHEKADLRSSEDAGTDDLEWLYVIEFTGKTTVMHVSHPKDTGKKNADGYRLQTWERVTTVDLHGPEPDWESIACGEKLEHCRHYAYKHFPELNGTTMEKLSTNVFMGREPLTFDDACAFLINGHEFYPTGSGSSGTDRNRQYVWIACVKAAPSVKSYVIPLKLRDYKKHHGGRFRIYDDVSCDIIVSKTNKAGKVVPYPGIVPVYPPTMNDPIRLFAELRNVSHAETTKHLSEQAAVSSQLAAMLATGRYFRDEEKVRA